MITIEKPLPKTLQHAPVSASPQSRAPAVPLGLRWLRWQLRLQYLMSPAWATHTAWRIFCTPRRLPAKPWEAKVLAAARRQWASTPTGRVAYYEWNPRRERTVLLVHGWEHRASFWGAMVQALSLAGYRVVAFDEPAHGASSGRQAIILEFGAAVQAVAAAAGPVHGVVAHSMGAAALGALPGFPTAAVAPWPRLVLLSAPSSPLHVVARFQALLQLPPPVIQRFMTNFTQRHGYSVDRFALLENGPRLGVSRALLLHDRQDATIPFAEAEELSAHWSQLDFRPTDGLGHTRIMREPSILQQIIKFLD